MKGTGGIVAEAFGDQAFGGLADDGGLDHAAIGAVGVDVGLIQVEAVQVADEGIFLVEGENAVLDGGFDGGFPTLDHQCTGIAGRQRRFVQGGFEGIEVRAGAGGGDGGEASVGDQAGAGGAVELFGSFLAGPVVGNDGELLTEFAEASLFVTGEDAVGETLADRLAPALGDDGADAVLIHERSVGDDGEVVQ